jgi:hypothetical protein
VRQGLGFVIASVLILFTAATARAGLFVTTGHTGAQVQADINHTQHWSYSLTAPVSGVDGALLTMKRGSQTTEDITFTLIQGTFADFGTVTPLMSVTLTPADFTQMFNPILFQGAPVNLAANTVYTGVLTSSAADMQSQAYFIKGLDDLGFVDENETPVDPGSEIVPGDELLPEPASLTLAGLLAVAALCRRRPA